MLKKKVVVQLPAVAKEVPLEERYAFELESLGRLAELVEVDSSGRFLIPKDLLSFASLKKEVVLASSVNMIEIWDKEKYESSVAETLKDFGNLSEEVMGGQLSTDSDEIS